ncbi:MAG: IS21 family transposase, partial [Gammaproteobacteria bacterium]|nr:IS21 family transposase [Gammaproteobacteria bacterium]
MRNLREILRLRYQSGLSLRQIKGSQRVSLGAVQKITSRADELTLDWEGISQLDDQQLARLFYPESDTRASSMFQLPDWVDVHQELRRKGMTKHLLWEEYTQSYPNSSYSYPQYCFLYQD